MAENEVNRLIDMLYERVEDAKSPALKPNLSMVDRDEILDLLDELRNQMPVELKRAQELRPPVKSSWTRLNGTWSA